MARPIRVGLVVGAIVLAGAGGFAIGRSTASGSPRSPTQRSPLSRTPEVGRMPLGGGRYAEVRTVGETYSPSRQCSPDPLATVPPDAVTVDVTFTTYPADAASPETTTAYYIIGGKPVTLTVDPGAGLPPEFCRRPPH